MADMDIIKANKKHLPTLCLFILFLGLIYPFIIAIVWAIVIAVAVLPVQQYIERYLSRGKATAVVLSLLLLFVLIPVTVILYKAAMQLVLLSQDPAVISKTLNSLLVKIKHLNYVGPFISNKLGLNNIEQYFSNSKYLKVVLGYIFIGGNQAKTFLIDFLLTLMFVSQFLMHRKSIYQSITTCFHDSNQHIDKWLTVLISSTKAVVHSILATVVIVFIVMTVTYFIIGLPNALLMGLLTAFVAAIPFILPFFYIAIILVLVMLGHVDMAISIGVVGFLLNFFTDNIVQPRILNKKTSMNFVSSFFGIISGLSVLGFVGIFVGPAVFNMVIKLFKGDLL